MIFCYHQRVADLMHRHRTACDQVEREERALYEVKDRLKCVAEAQEVLQSIAEGIQQQAHEQIRGIVSRCLEAVFDDPYEFVIRFEKKRGKTEAVLAFVRDGLELDDPLNEVGGGVIDVAAFALRVACVFLARPVRRRLLVLDEPFRNLRGSGNKRRLRVLLLSLSDELGMQFLINVDRDSYPEFALGKIVELEK